MVVNPDQNLRELNARALLLVGKQCWSVVAGEGTGSQVKLDFGERVPRKMPVRNLALSTEQQLYEGEIDLFVECAWRLEHRRRTLTGSTDTNRNDGPMCAGLSNLRDERVTGVSVSAPVPDLVLEFTNDLVLRLFCDQVNSEDDNYSLRIGDTILAVGSKGALVREVRKAD